MGCHTEPAAVHIAHVLQRLHFFQFFNFFYNLHDLPQKKNYTPLAQKKIIQNSFYNLHDLPQKNYTHLPQKKLHDQPIFLYMTYIFHSTDRAGGPEGAQDDSDGMEVKQVLPSSPYPTVAAPSGETKGVGALWA